MRLVGDYQYFSSLQNQILGFTTSVFLLIYFWYSFFPFACYRFYTFFQNYNTKWELNSFKAARCSLHILYLSLLIYSKEWFLKYILYLKTMPTNMSLPSYNFPQWMVLVCTFIVIHFKGFCLFFLAFFMRFSSIWNSFFFSSLFSFCANIFNPEWSESSQCFL